MYFIPDKCSDFSVVIKIRGKPPSPWKWEIYRAGHSRAVAQSTEFFSTVSAAKKGGGPHTCRAVREASYFIITVANKKGQNSQFPMLFDKGERSDDYRNANFK
jgi:hypothetical protein